MKLVMKYLKVDVPKYNREEDPIFHHASMLKEQELHTASQPMLKEANEEEDEEDDESTNSVTLSSDKQTISTESEDSKSQ